MNSESKRDKPVPDQPGHPKGTQSMERRCEPRLLCSELVEVHLHDRGRWRRIGTAILEDISPSGACLQLESKVPVGAHLRVRADRCELRGEVRWCQYREFGYFAGLRLEEGARWSRAAFEPEHLLDPSALERREEDSND
jgi:hypothetical protein